MVKRSATRVREDLAGIKLSSYQFFPLDLINVNQVMIPARTGGIPRWMKKLLAMSMIVTLTGYTLSHTQGLCRTVMNIYA
jgi:hypothetical protein